MIEKLGITPGPWKLFANSIRWSVYAVDDNMPVTICSAKKEQNLLKQTHDRQDRDAKLIAAAPEMLETLIIIADLEEEYFGGEPHYRVKTAIESATGMSWFDVKELLGCYD